MDKVGILFYITNNHKYYGLRPSCYQKKKIINIFNTFTDEKD